MGPSWRLHTAKPGSGPPPLPGLKSRTGPCGGTPGAPPPRKRGPPAGSYEAAAAAYEAYQYEEEESKVHIDLRERMRQGHAAHYWQLLIVTIIIVLLIGCALGIISAAIVYVSRRHHPSPRLRGRA